MGLQVTDRYTPRTCTWKGLKCQRYRCIWDVPVVLANRPDAALHNQKKTCLLIDMALPDDLNVNTKETEKKT